MDDRKIMDDISIGGQPDAADLPRLAQRGYRTVVNLRGAHEEGVLEDEKRLAEEAGLNYAEIPVTPETLDDLAVQRFQGAVTGTDGPPAYVHCRGGGRAGLLTLMHLALAHSWSLQQAYEEGERHGGLAPGPDSPYREFFESFIKRHSPAERR